MIYVLGDKNIKSNIALIGKANELAKKFDNIVKIIFIDDKVRDYQKGYKVDETILIKTREGNLYDYEIYSKNLLSIIDEKVDLIIFPSNEVYREIAAILSIRLNSTLLTEATDLRVEENKLIGMRPSIGGDSFSEFTFKDRPYLITSKSLVYSDESTKLENYNIDEININNEKRAYDIEEVINFEQKVKDIKDADIIFAGGRGLLGEENFKELRKLASFYNGSVAGSRPTVDQGYIKVTEQVGQTGSFVKPNVYLAFGISGAIQHIAGMKDSKKIIVINNNKSSNIFKFADYAIVADANSIIRNMINILQREANS